MSLIERSSSISAGLRTIRLFEAMSGELLVISPCHISSLKSGFLVKKPSITIAILNDGIVLPML
jgi:hypothetical protein